MYLARGGDYALVAFDRTTQKQKQKHGPLFGTKPKPKQGKRAVGPETKRNRKRARRAFSVVLFRFEQAILVLLVTLIVTGKHMRSQ
jgi:hypothetical protein